MWRHLTLSLQLVTFFAKIAAICRMIPKDSLSLTIIPAQWKQYWKIVNKKTSSSESEIHFGHFIVGCKLDIISHYHAVHISVTLAHAITLER
jgi:hypothetical protein